MRLQNAFLRVSKNAVVLFIGAVGKMLFSLAFTVYVARFLGVEGFGKFALTQSYFELFLSMSATGLSILITRDIAKQPSQLNRYLTASLILVTSLALVASGILIVISRLFGYASDTQAAIYVASIALLPAAISLTLEAVFVAFEMAEYVTYGTVLENIIFSGLGLMTLFMGYGLLNLFAILIVSRICMLLFYLIFLSRRISKLRWDYDGSFFKQLIHDWRVFALENWLANINNNFGFILLSIFHGEAAVGLYIAAGKILRLGRLVAQSYTTAIYPYMSRIFAESQVAFRRLSEGSLKYMLIFILPVVIAINILADRVIILLYTDEYTNAIPILQVLVWVLLLQFVNPFFSHILFARGEQQKSLQVATAKFILNVTVSVCLVYFWAGRGLAWSDLFVECTALCLYTAFVLQGEGAIRILAMLARPMMATASFGAFLWVVRDIQPVLLMILGGTMYVVLLFIFRVLSPNDLKLLQSVTKAEYLGYLQKTKS